MQLTLRRLLIALFFSLVSSSAIASSTDNHTGFYFYGMAGFMQATHDENQRVTPSQEFASSLVPAFGLTMGYNITDWIAPELQISYGTATGDTPSGEGREHLLTVRLNAKYSFLTNAEFNKDGGLKFYPYAKVGGLMHGLFVNAPDDVDKVGAYGGGFGAGGGVEFNYGLLYFGVDVSNDFVFLQEETEEIAGNEVTILNGGFKYQASVMGTVGIHF